MIDHSEIEKEIKQNRAFEVLERQERIDNAKSLTVINSTLVDKTKGETELYPARAKFWRTLGRLLIITWTGGILSLGLFVILR